jgi:UDP-N-acetylglucosamine 3-dehydrogenase
MQHGIAVIGLGTMSDAHLSGWRRLENVDLKAVVDVDPSRAEKKAKEYNIPSHETDFGRILDRDDIDIVDICLPHHLHAAFSCQALSAGKHVLVEKPIATSLSDARAMTQAAEKNGRKLMVAENVRFLPVYNHGKALLEGMEIGRSFMLTTRAEIYAEKWKFEDSNTNWRSDPEKIGGGVMLSTGIHSMSLVRGLVGEVKSVFAITGAQTRKEIPVENTMQMLFKFENGAVGQGSFSWATRWLADVMDTTIFGTEGVLGVDIAKNELWFEGRNERKLWVENPGHPHMGQWNLIAHLVDCVDNNTTPLTNGIEETESLKVVLAAYQSAREGTGVRIDQLR